MAADSYAASVPELQRHRGKLKFPRAPYEVRPGESAGPREIINNSMAEVTTKKRKRTGKQREEAKKAAMVSLSFCNMLICRRKLPLRLPAKELMPVRAPKALPGTMPEPRSPRPLQRLETLLLL